MESRCIAGLLAAAERLPDEPEVGAAILAAARVLEGSMSRVADAAELAGWASRRLDQLMLLPASTAHGMGLSDPLLTYISLSLGKTGAVAVRADLGARLDALSGTNAGDTWFWALAYDVFGDARFKALAVAARLPRDPLRRAFALLRLHQLTGDVRWIAAAKRVVARAPHARLSEFDTALLMAELKAPEQAVLPPFLLPLFASPRHRGIAKGESTRQETAASRRGAAARWSDSPQSA